jgi:hypothetical protein
MLEAFLLSNQEGKEVFSKKIKNILFIEVLLLSSILPNRVDYERQIFISCFSPLI